MSRREYEMTFRLNGEMSGTFRTSFRNASTEARALQSAMRDVNSQMSDIRGLQRMQNSLAQQQSRVEQTEARLERLQEAHRDLAAAMEGTENPSQRLRDQMERNEQQIQRVCDVLGSQQRELQETQRALEDAGVETRDLTAEAEELQRAYARLDGTNRFIQDISTALDENKRKLQEATGELAAMAGGYAAVIGGTYALTGKQAKDYESAFVGVEKAVTGTGEELAVIGEGILDMSQTDVIATANEIAAVAEAAGQLGIQTDKILDFSKVITDLDESTNLDAENGAADLAKFANITKMAQDDFDRLGSTIVDLGNNYATTEADIVSMGTRLASTGELTGLTEAEIMAMATALSSLGIEAEAGGSAASKFLKSFAVAEATGKMEEYADVAGMTEEAFVRLYNESNLAAVAAFTKGLNDEERNGKSAIQILEEMGVKEVRLSNAILALAASDDILTKTVETANTAWEENTALTIEAEKRYATTESRMTMAKNSVENLGIVLGDMMLPYLKEGADDVTELAMRAQRWVSENKEAIESGAKLALEVGGLIIAFKGMQVGYLGLKTAGLAATRGIAKVVGAIQATSVAAKGAKLGTFMNSLTGSTSNAAGFISVGAGTIAVLAAIAAAVWANNEAMKTARKEYADGLLFENGLPKLEEYTEALKSGTANTLKFAEEINSNSTELQEISLDMEKASAEVKLYGQALRTEGTLSQAEAEALKEPFGDLVSYLEQDFSIRYTAVFDAFTLAASEAASNLGVDIAEISSTLDSFKSKYTGSLSESEQVVSELLTRRSDGGTLTADELETLRSEMAYVAAMQDSKSENLYNYEQKAASLVGMDFGGNQELAVRNIQELSQYASEYLAEIDAAQQELGRYYDTLREDAATMLEYGKMTQAEYDTEIENLNLAQGVTYESYLANREQFTTEVGKTARMIAEQIDRAVIDAVDANGLSLWDYWIGDLASAQSGHNMADYEAKAQATYDKARANAINETRKLYSDVAAEANNLANTVRIDPMYLPVAVSTVINDSKSAYAESIKFNPANPYGLAQYAVGTTSAAAGLALVGEKGPELVAFGGGERVYTADQTRDILSGYQSMMIMPEVFATATAVRSSSFGGGISITVNSNPVFYGANGDIDSQIDDYNDKLAQKIRSVIDEYAEDTHRNAYS